jgi:hypothetical protein
MMRRVLVSGILTVGIGVIVLGLFWQRLHPPESYWPQEKARELMEASNEWHASQDSKADGKKGPDPAAEAAIKERYEGLKNELDRARRARNRNGSYVAAAGAAVIALGIWLYIKMPAQPRDDDDDWRH